MKKEERKAIFSGEGTSLKGEWDFSGENTQEYLHSLHPYPAKFIPQIPRKAILEYTNQGQTVMDPFAGCGTTLLESVLLGRNAIGIDNNAVACLVSRAKTAKYSEEEFQVLEDLENMLEDTDILERTVPNIPQYPNRDYWFDSEALLELGRLRTLIFSLPGNAQLLALAVFSSIVVSVSYQDGDTRYARKEYSYPKGKAYGLYRKKLKSALQDARETSPLVLTQAKIWQQDGRQISQIASKSISLIVTSPPYLNAYDYHKYHRHRLHWINGDVVLARDAEIGKHDTFTRKGATPDRYFEDMGRCFLEWERVLEPNGKILIVVGDAIVSGKAVPVADIFSGQLKELGLQEAGRWIRNIDTMRKSFNQKARVDQEHVLLFEKRK